VFAADELRMSVTSGQYRRLENSFTAIVVKDASFEWPFGPDSVAAHHQPARAKTQWLKLSKKTDKGEIHCFLTPCL